jgi:hypothetical protein
MATLYISEHTAGTIAGTQVVAEPAKAEQIVAITGSSEASFPFGEHTKIVRIHCDAVCSIVFGQSPTATTVNKRLAANQTECFSVNPGDQVAVIANV